MRKSIPRRDFHSPRRTRRKLFSLQLRWPLFFNLADRDRSPLPFFLLLKQRFFFVRVQHLRAARRVRDTLYRSPPGETYGTHVKVARIIIRFPERRGGAVFLSRPGAAAPFLRRVRDERGRANQRQRLVNVLRDIDIPPRGAGRVH